MNKKGNAKLIFVGIGVILFLVAIGIISFNNPNKTGKVTDTPNEIPNEVILNIADLPHSSDLNFNDYNEYLNFVSKTNTLIKILNEQTTWFDISYLDDSVGAFTKLSKSIEDVDKKVTKWGPLVNNYNEVISYAKIYKDNPTKENKNSFYYASVKFGFEFSIISGAVFYQASYQTVGGLYRVSGLSSFARTCPTCVSSGLSFAHWEIRNELGELSSKTFDKMKELDFNENKLNKIDFNEFSNKVKTNFWLSVGFTSEQIRKGIYYMQDSWDQLKNSEEYNKASEFLNDTVQKTGEFIDESSDKLKDWWENNF